VKVEFKASYPFQNMGKLTVRKLQEAHRDVSKEHPSQPKTETAKWGRAKEGGKEPGTQRERAGTGGREGETLFRQGGRKRSN